MGQRGNPRWQGGQIAGKGMVNRGERGEGQKDQIRRAYYTSHPPNIGTWTLLCADQHLWEAILLRLDIIRKMAVDLGCLKHPPKDISMQGGNSNGKRALTVTKIRNFDCDLVDSLEATWLGIERHGRTCTS